ncbi:unnamed protein product [Prorocentrum cordatum]|uniref:Uncharacterized protein n=1 Tax=Prorocentrum cordatum TaxID=2364126 RepID=A0ABN9R731_9DINO|nr:unnamed protein product [Polarella glacialis]
MPEHYCCATERLEARSYPGLPCRYVTHYCGLQLLESGARCFEELGLLAAEFETAEADKTNVWRWLTMDEAREAGTTGLPAACPGEGDDGAASPPEGARRSGGAPLPPPPQGASPAALAVAPPAAAARRRALGALGGCAGRLCG